MIFKTFYLQLIKTKKFVGFEEIWAVFDLIDFDSTMLDWETVGALFGSAPIRRSSSAICQNWEDSKGLF